MKPCTRCGSPHAEKGGFCTYCKCATGGLTGGTPVQSQAESSWADHVEDHRHELDYLSDGGWIDN